MPIEFRCANCHKLLLTSDETAGQIGKCPHCDAVMHIPSRAEGPASSDDAAAVALPVTGPVEVAGPYGAWAVGGPRPHHGPMVLTFGLLSTTCGAATTMTMGCMCCFPLGGVTAAGAIGFGIPAILIGVLDLKAIKAGEMDARGRSLTITGLVFGIVGMALIVLGVLLFVLVFVLRFGFMAANSGGRGF
jgi:phage FluMu protein Com